MYLARGIHAGYMRDTYEIHVSAEVRGYIEDTCGIHERYIMRYMIVSQLYPERYVSANVSCCILMYLDTFTIHARYMHDTWDTYPDNNPPQTR